MLIWVARLGLLGALACAGFGCDDDRLPPSPERAEAGVEVDAAPAPIASPVQSAVADLSSKRWVDAHMHCELEGLLESTGPLRCAASNWEVASAAGGAGLLVSIAHYGVLDALDALPAELTERGIELSQMNTYAAQTADQQPNLWYFASLDCWHDHDFGDAGWVAACKADVDRLLDEGAIGFKDHAGKQFTTAERDMERWLGAWNRRNGQCSPAPDSDAPNRDCMAQNTARYPMLESKWREVVRYITEVKQAAVLTHAATWRDAPERCFDPLTQRVQSCGAVTRAHLLAFSEWAERSLSARARSRIIIAHMGFLDDADSDRDLRVVLDRGFRVDTARPIDFLSDNGCAVRRLIAAYPKALVFGTDAYVHRSCLTDNYLAWSHMMDGQPGAVRTLPTCRGPLELVSLGLGVAQTDWCPDAVLQDGSRDRFAKLNFVDAITPGE